MAEGHKIAVNDKPSLAHNSRWPKGMGVFWGEFSFLL